MTDEADDKVTMEAALEIRPKTTRGTEMLLHHCLLLGRVDDDREPAAQRLEQALGPELAQLLLGALGVQPRRGCSSP